MDASYNVKIEDEGDYFKEVIEFTFEKPSNYVVTKTMELGYLYRGVGQEYRDYPIEKSEIQNPDSRIILEMGNTPNDDGGTWTNYRS